MQTQPHHFYDSLATHYHLIFRDWNQSIHRQANTLNAILTSELPNRPLTILDCACGIGTQALGLASLGHHVVASDLSPVAVARARQEAEARSLSITFHVADMTSLQSIPDLPFNVIAAFDNALPHLSPDQLQQATRAIAARLQPGGLFIASLRDYDKLLQQKPAVQEPAFFGDIPARRIIHQVWDWHESDHYTLHLFITVEADDQWTTHHFVSEYRCLTRHELSGALLAAGFHEPRWLMPEESGYYQPLVLARLP